MGLFSKLRGELVDIIEWLDDSRSTLVWRFPRYHDQIKNGAQLIVRPGQVAVFVREGQVADIFEPGTHRLETRNLPILSTIMGWKYGFDSPFKAEVYFVSTRTLTDLKWGTPNPVMLRDPEFGPIRLRAFGTFTLTARDPKRLLEELVGTDGVFETDELTTLMRGVINQALADVLGSSGMAALDLAGSYEALAEKLREEVCERIDDEYGLDVPQLFLVNVSLPEAVEKALDTRTSMGVIGDMGRFQQYQMGRSLTDQTGGGGPAADAMGLGVGLAMAQQFAGTQLPGSPMAPGATGGMAPPPPPAPSAWHTASEGQTQGPFSMQQLGQMVRSGQLTRDTMVWTSGMSGWAKAGEQPRLAPLFASSAPPPPPPPVG
ncbi:MAG: SPFH domain-containing protein [Planctomycetota bacterium]